MWALNLKFFITKPMLQPLGYATSHMHTHNQNTFVYKYYILINIIYVPLFISNRRIHKSML